MAALTYVFRRRERGQLLTPAQLIEHGPAVGVLQVGHMVAGQPIERCWLFDPSDPSTQLWDFGRTSKAWPREVIQAIKHARLERERDGVRFFRGVDDEPGAWWPQAWLCCPDAETGLGILRKMAS